jgi:hypothetical protein
MKSDVVSFAEEAAILASDAACLETPASLNHRYLFILFCFSTYFYLFFILFIMNLQVSY